MLLMFLGFALASEPPPLSSTAEGALPEDRGLRKLIRKTRRCETALLRAEGRWTIACTIREEEGSRKAERHVEKKTNRLVGKRARHVRAAERLVAYADPETTVEVFFATNRAPDERDYFGILDAGTLTWGIATVYVPAGHPDGALEKELQVAAVETFDEATFHARLEEKRGDASLFTLVHGYNNSFEYAVRRAAQITHDLEPPLVPVLFSWPTRGGTWFATAKYTYDENAAARSVAPFSHVLGGLLEEHAAPLFVMAHSMGSRVVAEALVDLDRQYHLLRRLDQLIFAAPDVDATVFQQRYLEVANAASRRLTLYCAADDRALKLSRGVHGGYDRLGSCREDSKARLHQEGVEVVDASMLYVDLVDHDKVASSPRLLHDLELVLAGVPAGDPKRGLFARGTWYELPP